MLEGVEALDDALGGAGGFEAVALSDGVRHGALRRGSSFDAEVVGIAGLGDRVGRGYERRAESALADRSGVAVVGFESSELRSRRGQDASALDDFGFVRLGGGDGADYAAFGFLQRVDGGLRGSASAFGLGAPDDDTAASDTTEA